MAKFNIEIELDWLDDDVGVDDSIKQEVISGLQNRIIHNLEEGIKEKVEERVSDEVDKVVEAYLEKVTLKTLDEMTIPYKESSWSSQAEHIPLSEYIGKKYKKTISEKTLTERGGKPDYSRDAKYSIMEYLTRGYIAKELNGKVIDMIQQAKIQAEETLISNLEDNLQQQLNADMLQRLNIPDLLKGLQNTISIEGDK